MVVRMCPAYVRHMAMPMRRVDTAIAGTLVPIAIQRMLMRHVCMHIRMHRAMWRAFGDVCTALLAVGMCQCVIFLCMYVCMYACMHAQMYTRIYVCMHVYIRIFMYVHVCRYTFMHARVYRGNSKPDCAPRDYNKDSLLLDKLAACPARSGPGRGGRHPDWTIRSP
jgi:hypothetical protein